jgi:hypothetical protein
MGHAMEFFEEVFAEGVAAVAQEFEDGGGEDTVGGDFLKGSFSAVAEGDKRGRRAGQILEVSGAQGSLISDDQLLEGAGYSELGFQQALQVIGRRGDVERFFLVFQVVRMWGGRI